MARECSSRGVLPVQAWILMVAATTGGCAQIIGVDEDYHGFGAGGTGTTTGGGGTGGITGGGGTGGITGGTGGTMCVPVDDNKECTDDLCDADNMPVHVAKASGDTCMNGGTQCDGNGNCVECLGPTDCPGEDNACQTRTCTAGACSVDFVTSGTALPTQTPGDCKVSQCTNGLPMDVDDDADLPDDGKDCTVDLCNGGEPSHMNAPADTGCGPNLALKCDGAGNCVDCLAAANCGADTECQQHTCTAGVCGVLYAAPGTACNEGTGVLCDGAGNCVE